MDEFKLKRDLRRLTIIFIVISAFILICGIFASISLIRIFRATQSEQNTAQAHEYCSDFQGKIQSDMRLLQSLSSFFEYSNGTSDEQFTDALYHANSKTTFSQMSYIKRDGLAISVSRDGIISTNSDFETFAPEMISTVEQAFEDKSVISNPYYDEYLKEDVITYAVPILSNSKVVGVLSANENLSNFNELLNAGSFASQRSTVAIIDKNGNIIFASSRVTTSGLKYFPDWEAIDNNAKQEIMSAFFNYKPAVIEFDVYNYECYAIIEPVNIRDWSIIVIDTKNGISDPLYQNMNITRITSIIPLILAIFCIFYGYNRMRKNNEKLLHLAYYDSLTGAYNMEKFNRLLESAWDNNSNYHVAGINIRHFKFINELFGVEQANNLLCHIKNVLENNINLDKFFCRESADSFFVFMRESSREGVTKRLNKIVNEIQDVMLGEQQKYPISIYCGIASTLDCSNKEKRDVELIAHVMFALNRAKNNSNGNFHFYDLEMYRTEQLQNYIESHMNTALETGEFKLFLQPKTNLKNYSLGGAEALVRWITNDGNMIFPDQFIPLFEQNGFCTKLDLYMVERVCELIRKWVNEGIEPIPISVNQTKLLFYDSDYAKKLCTIIEKYDVPAKLITLEILEGLALSNVEDLNNRIFELKQKGFKISMDDFGSGYSSLNTLGNIDIDELKLDRAFMNQASISEYNRQRLIMEQIILLAKKMSITTVAEGIETRENEKMITELGCDFGQGYFYSRPISASDFETKYMLDRKNKTSQNEN